MITAESFTKFLYYLISNSHLLFVAEIAYFTRMPKMVAKFQLTFGRRLQHPIC